MNPHCESWWLGFKRLTEYLTRTEPRYWDLASIFEDDLVDAPDHCPNRSRTLPPIPLKLQEIGVWWEQLDGRWFVAGIMDGGPAAKAGLRLGDEILTADSGVFSPVTSFANKDQRDVVLTYRREASGKQASGTVRPHVITSDRIPRGVEGERQDSRCSERSHRLHTCLVVGWR